MQARAKTWLANGTMGQPLLLLSAVVFFAALTGGCNPNSIGRPCVAPTGDGGAPIAINGTDVSSPALECPSRLCLIQQTSGGAGGADAGSSRNTCTASCSSDSDCEAETKELCPNGFRCAVATDVGNYCCRKLCVCSDDLTEGFNKSTPQATASDPNPKPKIVTPFACDPKLNPSAATNCSNVKG